MHLHNGVIDCMLLKSASGFKYVSGLRLHCPHTRNFTEDTMRTHQPHKEQDVQIILWWYCELLRSSHSQLRFISLWIPSIDLLRCDLLALRLNATSLDRWNVQNNLLTCLTIRYRAIFPLLEPFRCQPGARGSLGHRLGWIMNMVPHDSMHSTKMGYGWSVPVIDWRVNRGRGYYAHTIRLLSGPWRRDSLEGETLPSP